MAFDYIDEQPSSGKFDYIDEEGQKPSEPYKGSIPFDPEGYKTQGMLDTSIPDAMVVQGVAGLAKALPGLAASGAKAVLPSTAEEILTRGAANNVLKGTGASLGQIRQIGPEAARETGLFGLKQGAADIFSTKIGTENKINALEEATGKALSGLRKEAGQAPDYLEALKSHLTPKYAEGVYSGEQGALGKALSEIKPGATHADLAKTATKLNDYASGAKMTQPVNATTDVANTLSRLNNEGIVQGLGAEKGLQYTKALENYPKIEQLKAFLQRGEAKEAVPHGAVGNIMHSILQPLKNAVGYKGLAKGQMAAAEALQNAPSLGQNLGNIAKPAMQLAPSQADELKKYLDSLYGGQ